MTADRLLELRCLGYTVLPGAISPGQVAEARAAIDRLLEEDDRTFGGARLIAAGQRGALRNLADRGAEFERMLDLVAVHELARDLLGTGYRLHSYDALVLGPGEGRFPWDFHTDLHALRAMAFPRTLCPGMNCLFAVDDSSASNGATWIVPGSHRATGPDPEVELLAELAEQPALTAGDLLVFDARLWHCAGHNRADASRRLIKLEFVQPWLRTQMDYARSVRDEVRSRLGPAAREALGRPEPATPEDVLCAAEQNA
jgi:hypothetical protein